MSAKKNESVVEYIQKLEPKLSELLMAIRQVVLESSSEVKEHIKWNVPAFYYDGEMLPFDPKEYKRDLIVTNFHKKDYVLLIFPSGAKVQDKTSLFEGDYKDGRRMIRIDNKNDLATKAEEIKFVIQEWIKVRNI